LFFSNNELTTSLEKYDINLFVASQNNEVGHPVEKKSISNFHKDKATNTALRFIREN
jgi:hypothetical protein